MIEVEPIADRDAGLLTFRAEVRATARTGVEMEALTAAAIAALTAYDMGKALQRDIVIERVRLLEKSGGPQRRLPSRGRLSAWPAPVPEAIVVVVSTRAAAGTRPDTVGPDLVNRLKAAGWEVEPRPEVLPDDEARLAARLIALVDAGHRLIVTTGGTGLTPTDRTPEATIKVGERQVPGIAELIRSTGHRDDVSRRPVPGRGGRARADTHRQRPGITGGRGPVIGRGHPGPPPRGGSAGRRRPPWLTPPASRALPER